MRIDANAWSRQLAPEADLATVLQLATDALRHGVMLDPEDLLCQLLGLNPAQLLAHLEDQEEEEKTPPGADPDRSGLARARARGTWRVAEAGMLAHLVGRAREPLCGAQDPGPWRAVAGAVHCAACTELQEVLARHG